MRCADAVLTKNNIKNNALPRRKPVCGRRRDFRGLWIVVDIDILRMFSTPQYRRAFFQFIKVQTLLDSVWLFPFEWVKKQYERAVLGCRNQVRGCKTGNVKEL